MWGLTGCRFFSPPDMDKKEETYLVHVLALQCAFFGPLPDKYVELAVDLTAEHLHSIEALVVQRGGRLKHRRTLSHWLNKETIDFLDDIMKLDPRDRPSAQELLQHQWLSNSGD